jgi:hypothetical protein
VDRYFSLAGYFDLAPDGIHYNDLAGAEWLQWALLQNELCRDLAAARFDSAGERYDTSLYEHHQKKRRRGQQRTGILAEIEGHGKLAGSGLDGRKEEKTQK